MHTFELIDVCYICVRVFDFLLGIILLFVIREPGYCINIILLKNYYFL